MNWAIVELYCGESGKLGYYNSQELGLARAIASKNINVTIVYPDRERKTQDVEEVEERICILRIPCKTLGVHAFYHLDFLLERRIDVVHLDSDNQIFAPSVIKFCRKHHIFCYNYIGTIYSDTENLLKRSFMKMISFRNIRYFRNSPVVVKTAAVRRCLEEQRVKGIELVPVGLDTTKIEKSEKDKKSIRRELGFPEDKQILLFVGRLEEYKRPFAALDLLKSLGDAYYLVVIGAGSMRQELEAWIQREKLEPQIFYIEKIPNILMYQYYKACDYYINLNIHEIFGMSILEAMYQGCTVVARKAPGPEEIIEDGISGYLCSTDEEMKRIILADKKLDIGNQAEERIRSSFTWEQSAKRLIQFVEDRRE
jgi:1,2-diacylglycerol 3-alpha-glucosyltransferase